MYEYKFVRLPTVQNWLIRSAPTRAALDRYQEEVHKHAREGWRLVQVFAPGIGLYGSAGYYELIFEREAKQPPSA